MKRNLRRSMTETSQARWSISIELRSQSAVILLGAVVKSGAALRHMLPNK
jgi:hypothetical protein